MKDRLNISKILDETFYYIKGNGKKIFLVVLALVSLVTIIQGIIDKEAIQFGINSINNTNINLRNSGTPEIVAGFRISKLFSLILSIITFVFLNTYYIKTAKYFDGNGDKNVGRPLLRIIGASLIVVIISGVIGGIVSVLFALLNSIVAGLSIVLIFGLIFGFLTNVCWITPIMFDRHGLMGSLKEGIKTFGNTKIALKVLIFLAMQIVLVVLLATVVGFVSLLLSGFLATLVIILLSIINTVIQMIFTTATIRAYKSSSDFIICKE